MKIVKKSTENCNFYFYSREISLYIAWACFRNVTLSLEGLNTAATLLRAASQSTMLCAPSKVSDRPRHPLMS